MRKVLLTVLILALLAGLTYVKTVEDRRSNRSSFDEGRRSGLGEVTTVLTERDSLRTTITAEREALGDSLSRHTMLFQTALDSLELALCETIESVDSLESELASRPAQVTAAKPPAVDPIKEGHTKILAYYKNRYGNLPQDLSNYERRIAVNEIREETADKFSISLGELEKIRRANNIQY